MLLRAMLMAALVLTGCRTIQPPKAEVRYGATPQKGSLRVVLFPASCSDQGDVCSHVDAASLTAAIAKELEFEGHTVVDGATLVKTARTRETAGASLKVYGERFLDVGAIQQGGALFDDLPPDARRELLDEAHADGIVRARLTGVAQGYWYSRIVELQLRLGLGGDEAPAWTARCTFEGASVQAVGGPPLWREAVEEGVKCALAAVERR